MAKQSWQPNTPSGTTVTTKDEEKIAYPSIVVTPRPAVIDDEHESPKPDFVADDDKGWG